MDWERPLARGRARGRSRGVVPGQEVTIAGAQGEVELTQPMDFDQGQRGHVSDMFEGDSGTGPGGSGGGNNRDQALSGRGNGNGGNGESTPATGPLPGSSAQSRRFRQENSDFVRTRRDGFDKKGTSGLAKRYLANFFPLQTKNSVSMRLHTVTFKPEVTDEKVRMGLLRQKESLIGPYLFDGNQLFTAKEIPLADTCFDVSFPDKPEVFQIKINFLRQVTSLEPLAFQLYNLIVRKTQKLLDLNLLGRHYFDPNGRIEIRNYKLELWPGFITSMRQQESEVLLNVDLTYKVIRMDNVFDKMKEIRQHSPEDFMEKCNTAIVGTIVLTRYNNKTYRVDDIDWKKKPTDTFPKGQTGEQISFIDYYKSRYGKVVSGVQPLLVSKPGMKDIRRGDTGDKLLVPELCFMTGLNEEMRANFRLMKDLSAHLHQAPGQRLAAIQAFMGRIAGSEKVRDEIQNRWGMRLKVEPVEVQGRLMPSEAIVFAGGEVKPNEQGDWSMAFRNQKMLSCAELNTWALIVSQRDKAQMENLFYTMQKVAGPLGYAIKRPELVTVGGGSARDFTKGIQDTMARFKSKIDLLMIILPSSRLDTYAAVKKMCAIDYGIPSQCFLSKNVTKPGIMSICTKLVIQMNAKQGGEPWGVKNPLQGVMIVGFDVYHGGGRSVGAMSASVTSTFARYYSTITSQETNVDMSAKVGAAFERCLKAYKRVNNGKLPSRIFFYRDGVSEGQLQVVNSAEVPEVWKVIKVLYTGLERPKLTYIVVTKRVNARIFEIRGNGDYGNPGPGTVIDDRITCPERYDFYLVPQSARQGTVSPVSYNVLVDTSGLDADKIQRFTFKLCHVYFNWSGTVPVPAPCQYAHKLAFLTGTALQKEANEKLCDLLHFL